MKILIVDDDPKYRSYVSRGLEQSGMSCEVAADGETALDLLRAKAYDLVLLDVMLPGLQGWGRWSKPGFQTRSENKRSGW
jgi:two-component system copper resistance phosphate regulon response regulator CusR